MMVQERVSLRVLPSKVGSDRADVEIYRPFFLAGIICVLTVGCLLGAVALLGIANQRSYTASAWTPYILAHANSQLFGWVGFFVMGFALQQHAPSVNRVRIFHRLAFAALVLMALGIAMRFVAEPMCLVDRDLWLPVGVASGVLQIASVGLFLYNMAVNRFRSGNPVTWPSAFVFSSLFWLVVVSIIEPVAFVQSHQLTREASILFIAGWMAPLREAQFLGFVAMMIFGVAAVKLASCLGFREATKSWGLLGLGLWWAGLIARIVGWRLAFGQGFEPGSDLLYRTGGVLLALGASAVVLSLGVFERTDLLIRAHKFVRAAFAWLLIAGLLLALEPLHLAAIQTPFSHAYTGAVRHAVTVGFISQMILGVGIHVVGRMNAVNERQVSALWVPFLLINIGNAARVGLEIATDYRTSAFLPMGWTGFIELLGLGIWAAAMVGPMVSRRGKHAFSQARH